MKHMSRTLLAAALALAFASPSFAAGKPGAAKPRPPAAREARPAAPPATEARSEEERQEELSGQVVYQVLLAEIALQRGNPELAAQAYASLAMRTRDPKVLERTVEVAGYARRFDIALEAAKLWQEIDPASARAQQMVSGVLLMSNRLDELAPHLVRMLETDKEGLAGNLLGLNRMLARNPDRQAVFRLIDKVCAPFFGLAEAHYAVAMAAGSAGELPRARAEVRRALELRPDWEMAALLQAQLLSRDSSADGIASLQAFLERNPQARDVRLHLARALVADKQYVEARQHFDRLLRDYPDNPDVVYPVAILALQQNDLERAEAQLKHLLTLEFPDRNIVYYYLGQIAEDGKRSAEALAYYAQVGAGEQQFPARLRLVRILGEQGKLDEARRQLHATQAKTPQEGVQLLLAEAQLLRDAKQFQQAYDLLDKALAEQPVQPELLYEAALLAEKLGQVDTLERLLRRLIEVQPASAQAYNALGYSFAERNIRLPEARELIAKALALAPDDPFIMDSMGWVLYRQGELAGALAHLERAYAQRQDPEIAAHLGEVLWMLGRKDDARRTLREASKNHPANEVLADALKKFPD
ncbi:MAG: pilus assembly protein TadD [Candidatus Accumulibacter sp.]|nr:pilus assembly protein TadD [Accumulibacter sp.]MBA4092676.1 pilus assembly protein TadD [Accumulibacter sp.]